MCMRLSGLRWDDRSLPVVGAGGGKEVDCRGWVDGPALLKHGGGVCGCCRRVCFKLLQTLLLTPGGQCERGRGRSGCNYTVQTFPNMFQHFALDYYLVRQIIVVKQINRWTEMIMERAKGLIYNHSHLTTGSPHCSKYIRYVIALHLI